MQITFRVDAGLNTGVGHLMRCLALAQWLDEYHVDLVFAVREVTLPYCHARHDWVGQILVIPEDIADEEEIDWLASSNIINESAVVVLDGYQFNQQYRQALRDLAATVIVFDDLQDNDILYADVVINGADGVNEDDYKSRAPTAELCLGRPYRLFRKEFVLTTDVPWKKRHSLTISMGGTDPHNLTVSLLNEVSQQDRNIPIRILCGSGYQHIDGLQEVISKIHNPVQLIQNCQDVADIFTHTRLAIAAAGSTQFELLQCATPSMLVTVAENQRQATEAAKEQGWCQTFEAIDNINLHALASEAVSLYHNNVDLEAMHLCAVDKRISNSSLNTVDVILKRLAGTAE